LLTIFDLKSNDADDTFVVMEYVAGPSLASVLKQYPSGLPLSEVRHWLKGLVEGVAYLHDHGIVHRDLKPANLFLEEGIVKIGDYGLAKLITPSQGTDHSESIGTCHYMAPEIGSGKYNKPIDIYAIGIILQEMLTGQVPFDGETVNEVLMKHLTARPDVSMLPEPYQAIVSKALAKDPNQRPSRVYDLLPPEDVPRPPEVRIIGDGKSGSSAAARDPANTTKLEDDVLRIQAEEPIFYIGPETHPPRTRTMGGIKQHLQANWEAMWRPRCCTSQASRTAQHRSRRNAIPPRADGAVRQEGYARPVSDQPLHRASVPPPPEPPSLPSGRIRLAELASSMLWAAPLVALLSIPAAALLSIDSSGQPQQFAYLYGMTLLGTWIALVPGKIVETRRLDRTTQRLMSLAAGLLLGIIGTVLAHNMHLGLTAQNAFFSEPQNLEPVYFGALYALTVGWWSLAARDRRARFRVSPILWTGFLSTILLPFWPYDRQDGIAVAVLIATAVQLVSPWNEAASVYARFVRASEKKKCYGKVLGC
jgi:hypothetical protein